ncbi:unnamed protein product [Rotaria sp. Silwood1]|nr:unnamed protein product [Rotaria sp. Silwood1]CAF1567954.1 unnamed protein product [Rotaria sp. Silwood1]CAF1569957.1 unnamed protein product [Rotaria sp. Silwood1]
MGTWILVAHYITYLLSLCEHGDLHLRGACTNLLVTLIQTTIHLLTLSLLSNSFHSSFINQRSLLSTDSQDSSSHAFTIIRIELLEDSIQHSTSSCILAKHSNNANLMLIPKHSLINSNANNAFALALIVNANAQALALSQY